MKYATLPGVDKPVARLLQGTVMMNPDDRDANFRLLDACLENDSPPSIPRMATAGGSSERELGAWIAARGVRDEVVILTKGAHPYAGEPDRVKAHFIRQDLEESWNACKPIILSSTCCTATAATTPVGEIVDVLHEYQQKGHIGVYGGSNWLGDRVAAANAYAAANGKSPFTVSSPQFSVAEMVKPPWDGCISVSGEQGEADRRFYDDNEISLFTWSSLAGGFMTGKFTRANLDDFENYWDTNPIGAYAYEGNFQRLDRALELAADKGLSPAQISVAYVLSNSPRYHAIVANWEAAQVPENAAAADLQLSADEIACWN